MVVFVKRRYRVVFLKSFHTTTFCIFVPPKNIRKPLFLSFQGLQKKTSGVKWFKGLEYFYKLNETNHIFLYYFLFIFFCSRYIYRKKKFYATEITPFKNLLDLHDFALIQRPEAFLTLLQILSEQPFFNSLYYFPNLLVLDILQYCSNRYHLIKILFT